MSKQRQRRRWVRAPLKEDLLYTGAGHVHRARCLNVSEGGLFVENFPIIPTGEAIPLLIALPVLPLFEDIGRKKILTIDRQDVPLAAIRLRARITRSFEGQSEVDKVFVSKIGMEFTTPGATEREALSEYVQRSRRNILHLLALFEESAEEQRPQLLAHIAHLLDYPATLKWPLLRANILHDYHSLETP